MRGLVMGAVLAAAFAGQGLAQDRQETLADIRQELSILFVEIQRLNRELSTTGTPTVNLSGSSVPDRVAAIEFELQRLTAQTEQLQFRVESIVADGTNRVGDLEFRLCELEDDCDIGALGDTPSLGGVEITAPALPTPRNDEDELAVAEQRDFDAASQALDNGDYAEAAVAFADFAETYTGGALTAQAQFHRGEALEAMGDTANAARAYLTSFSAAPNGPVAAHALLRLGLSLDALGQRTDACITLGEVQTRFPGSEAGTKAESARADLSCF